MAKIIRKITGLKPGQNYLVTLKAKNTELSALDNAYPAIRFLTPTDNTIPSAIDNDTFFIYANYKSVMFVFEPTTDIDVDKYKYELYADAAGTNLISSGTATASVFTIDVPNNSQSETDTDSEEQVKYYGRIKTVDTSGNESGWTPSSGLKESSPTQLIESAHIRNLTASKITAGTINAHEIILKQQGAQTSISAPANMAILRSSDYNGSYNNSTNQWSPGTSGWVIAGNGYAEFATASLRGGLRAESVFINADNRWRRNSTNTDSSSEFKVGSSSKYLLYDGTNLTFTGNLSAVGGTFTGTLSGVNGNFTGTLTAGSVRVGHEAISSGSSEKGISIQASGLSQWNNAWIQRADNSVYFRAGNNTRYIQLDTSGTNEIKFPNFSVNNDGLLTANNANITGHIDATSGTFSGTLSGANGTFTGTLNGVGGNFTGTISANQITGGQMSADRISGGTIVGSSFQSPGGRIELDQNETIIKLGTASSSGATQCFIYPGGNQGFHVETSNNGSMWIAGAHLYPNLIQFTSGRYIVGLQTDFGNGTRLVVSNQQIYREGSKRELKENIQDFNNISLIDGLRPRTFTWKALKNRKNQNNEETEEQKLKRESAIHIGFIAEEVEEASDGLLSIYNDEEDGDGEVVMYKQLDILALAVANIQDLRKRVADLENS